MVVGPAAEFLKELEETTKRQFFLVGIPDVHLDHFRVLDQGAVEKVAPTSDAVTVGQELELKLGEIGLYDPHAGVAKVKGTDVYVADAAKLVGKKVRLRVTAVMEGVAYAELLDGQVVGEPPITAEAEAEKPTRARKPAPAKKVDAGVEDDELEAESDEDDALEDEVEELEVPEAAMEFALEAEDAEPVSAEEIDATGEPGTTTPKKRTRRGTRGGRNRRKKPAGAAATADEASVAEEEELEAVAEEVAEEEELEAVAEAAAPAAPKRAQTPRGPVIHVPGPELGQDGEGSENGDAPTAVKKPTRRGSRGGRNRRKKPAGATAAAAVATDEATDSIEAPAAPSAPVVVEAPASANGTKPEDTDAWEYTPMSQWDDVDEKAS
jgi:predicted RNA-binding protein with TRAM domain